MISFIIFNGISGDFEQASASMVPFIYIFPYYQPFSMVRSNVFSGYVILVASCTSSKKD
jgi:hypothetical protein